MTGRAVVLASTCACYERAYQPAGNARPFASNAGSRQALDRDVAQAGPWRGVELAGAVLEVLAALVRRCMLEAGERALVAVGASWRGPRCRAPVGPRRGELEPDQLDGGGSSRQAFRAPA